MTQRGGLHNMQIAARANIYYSQENITTIGILFSSWYWRDRLNRMQGVIIITKQYTSTPSLEQQQQTQRLSATTVTTESTGLKQLFQQHS